MLETSGIGMSTLADKQKNERLDAAVDNTFNVGRVKAIEASTMSQSEMGKGTEKQQIEALNAEIAKIVTKHQVIPSTDSSSRGTTDARLFYPQRTLNVAQYQSFLAEVQPKLDQRWKLMQQYSLDKNGNKSSSTPFSNAPGEVNRLLDSRR